MREELKTKKGRGLSYFLILAIAVFMIYSCSKDKKKVERSELSIQETEDKVSSPEKRVRSDQTSTDTEKDIKKKKILAAIQKEKDPAKLKVYIDDPEGDIVRAAVQRLGEIGGQESLEILSDAFQRQPRSKGTDASAGMKGEILESVARTGDPAAKDVLLHIIDSWLRAGPLDKGLYSHIYDSEYYAVLITAIEALQSFPDEEVTAVLTDIPEDRALFYLLREAAYRTLLTIDMGKSGLITPSDQAGYLLAKIEPEGVFAEEFWTGEKPGDMTIEAGKEMAIENLLVRLEEVDALIDFLGSLPADEMAKRTAVCRVVLRMLMQDALKEEKKFKSGQQKDTALGIIAALEDLPKEKWSSETLVQIFNDLTSVADILEEEDIWTAIRRLSGKAGFASLQEETPPKIAGLSLYLPSDSAFIASMSRRIDTPFGVLVKAYYLSEQDAKEVVSHIEELTRKRAQRKEIQYFGKRAETAYTIDVLPAPEELIRLLEVGITVFDSPDGFEERVLGQTLRRGKTLIRVTWLKDKKGNF